METRMPVCLSKIGLAPGYFVVTFQGSDSSSWSFEEIVAAIEQAGEAR